MARAGPGEAMRTTQRPAARPRRRSIEASRPAGRDASWMKPGIDEFPRFLEARLCERCAVAGMRSHRKAVARALVVAEFDRSASVARALLEPAHPFDRCAVVAGAMHDQGRHRDFL